jgi:hypothetical protein
VVSVVRRHAIGMVLSLAWVAVAIAFVVLPQARLWNARLLPFMYLSVALLAAIGVGEVVRIVGAAASGNVKRPLRIVTVGGATVVIFGAFLYTTLPHASLLPGVIDREAVTDTATNTAKTRSSLLWFSTTASHPGAGWARNNYTGLEAKEPSPPGCDAEGSAVPCTSGGWEEFRDLVATMDGIGRDERYGCGRAFWEYEKDRVGGYGTPMALMMLPYFTESCIGSQEGLYFESSATVPYHFLMQSELSTRPSQPQRDLSYPGFDLDAGVRHLQLLGVRYYLATSPSAVAAADEHDALTKIAVSGPWHIYQVADSDTVAPLAYEPVVVDGLGTDQDGWLPTAAAWFLDPDALAVPLAADGPEGWQRIEVEPVPEELRRVVRYARDQVGATGPIDQLPELPQTPLPEIEVSDIETGVDTISFSVSEPGVPVLVRTSAFPNWEVDGAEGPYRVTPNLMVVVPTERDVSLRFGRTPVDYLAMAMSVLGLIGLVWLARRPAIDMEPPRQTRLADWIDAKLTIESPVAEGSGA